MVALLVGSIRWLSMTIKGVTTPSVSGSVYCWSMVTLENRSPPFSSVALHRNGDAATTADAWCGCPLKMPKFQSDTEGSLYSYWIEVLKNSLKNRHQDFNISLDLTFLTLLMLDFLGNSLFCIFCFVLFLFCFDSISIVSALNLIPVIIGSSVFPFFILIFFKTK